MHLKEIKKLYPPATIGIVGGGQLGRMFTFEAKRMGYHVVILDPKINSPAGQVADEQIVADFDAVWAYKELARKTDVITFEFEHINAEILSLLESDGFPVIPSSKTLKMIQNKYVQKCILQNAGIKGPTFYKVNTLEALKETFHLLNQKVIIKSCLNGYDGKGNLIVKSEEDLEKAYSFFNTQEIFVEELIDLYKEVSILVVKNAVDTLFYPVVENTHSDSILIKTVVPAQLSKETSDKIQQISAKIVDTLDDFGVFCIEYFIDQNGDVLVNEIAPRPHNSGHYSIEGCPTSQFEQLVRVVCGMPIGASTLRKPCVMVNLLGDLTVSGRYRLTGLEGLYNIPECYFHLYGKAETDHLKKIGHITVMGNTQEDADEKAKTALSLINILNV